MRALAADLDVSSLLDAAAVDGRTLDHGDNVGGGLDTRDSTGSATHNQERPSGPLGDCAGVARKCRDHC